VEIMASLRTPGTGCPWDVRQTFETIAPYTIEEAYEVVDAIARRDFENLRDELGDLLLQVVFHARMAEEQGRFDFGDVVEAITEKLVRRHPHVFGTAGNLSEEEVSNLWERIKNEEKAARAAAGDPTSPPAAALAGVPAGLPALVRARKLQSKAAGVGFDWGETAPVLEKVREEIDEVASAVSATDEDQITREVGDLLFAVVNLARHLDVDPETALRMANHKFERRFATIEHTLAAQGKSLNQATLAEMDALWNECKRAEKVAGEAAMEADPARVLPRG
jgi:ATP diphosphatase